MEHLQIAEDQVQRERERDFLTYITLYYMLRNTFTEWHLAMFHHSILQVYKLTAFSYSLINHTMR